MTEQKSEYTLWREEKAQEKRDAIQPEIDAWMKDNPNAPSPSVYDYHAAREQGGLPDGADAETAWLNTDYYREGFSPKKDGVLYNASTKQFGYKSQPSLSLGEAYDQAIENLAASDDPRKYVAAAVPKMVRDAVQGNLDIIQRTPYRMAENFFSTAAAVLRLFNDADASDYIDMERLKTDPQYAADHWDAQHGTVVNNTFDEAWNERLKLPEIEAVDATNEIVSEIGALFLDFGVAEKTVANMMVNPAKFSAQVQRWMSRAKTALASGIGETAFAYGGGTAGNFSTMLREWGFDNDVTQYLDSTMANDETDMALRNFFDGLGFGTVLELAAMGVMKGIPAIQKYAKGLEKPAPWKAQEGKIQLRTRIKRYTTRAEQELLNPKMEKKIEKLLEHSATPQEVAAMAAAGGAKRGWYRSSMAAIRHVFGADSEKFTSLLASTSPQTQVESNLRNTLNLWKNWTKAGRPRDEETILKIMGDSVEGDKGEGSILNAWKNNSLEVLMRDDTTLLSGPKVHSFWRNLMGFFDEVTQDTHMARAEGLVQKRDFDGAKRVVTGKKGVKGGGYIAGNMLIREAADIMTKATGDVWTAAEIQETVWSWVKTIWDAEKGDARSIPQLLKEGAITDDMIRDTPDFATMFSQKGEFRQILEDAGYGSKLDNLPDTGYGQAGAVSSGTGQSRHLESSAQRLDRTKRVTGTKDPKYQNAEQIRQFWLRNFSSEGSPKGTLPRLFRRDVGRDGGRVLEGQKVTTYSLPEDVSKEFNALGVSTPTINEITDPELFVKFISNAKTTNKFGSAVHVYSPEEYADMRLFITDDGTAGAALKKDGDMVSLFNTKGGPHKNISRYLFNLQVQEGGTKLDCFDIGGYLPTLYQEMGFKIKKRNKFVMKYAPEGWDYDLLGKPDIVYMEKAK